MTARIAFAALYRAERMTNLDALPQHRAENAATRMGWAEPGVPARAWAADAVDSAGWWRTIGRASTYRHWRDCHTVAMGEARRWRTYSTATLP